uniref:Uncharacterized protein n=1 Tax=Avena sativa TaxID=4498 RepID=A0ACD6AGG9_AVESA
MPTEVIIADTVNDAVYAILRKMESNHKARERNVIYFGGWDGLGASAVLRAIPQVLASKEYEERSRPRAVEFERVIHIDFSHWESTRAVQRAIAEQLELPSSVMKMIDKQDEEDDFNGVDKGSRSEIPDAVVAIHKRIQGSTFLLVLHNGSGEEINTDNLGLSLNWYMANGVVWTFHSGSLLHPKDLCVKDTTPFVLLAESFKRDPLELRSYLLHEDAKYVARKYGVDPATVVECLLYMLERSYMSLHTIDCDWALHAGNYWMCDGIVQKAHGIREAWQLADGLHREMKLYIDYLSGYNLHRQACKSVDRYNRRLCKMGWSAEHRPYFISTETCEFVPNLAGIISYSMFQHSQKLSVLKLSRCTFRFTSPPFLCCHSIRFLCLDHCQNLVSSTDAEEEEIIRSWRCFESLWVLDLRYTHWNQILSAHMLDLMTQLRELNVMGAQNLDMSHLHGRLSNIHKLRVTNSRCCCSSNLEETGRQNLFFEMERMELFEFLENHTTQGMTSLFGAARSSSLKTVTVGGCVGLENISLHGCKELQNLFFRGLLGSLKELDLSDTAIKILDLRKLEAAHLKRLILLGCEKLRAILWPLEDKNPQIVDVLHINTIKSASSGQSKWEKEKASASTRSSSATIAKLGTGRTTSFDSNWSITVRDQTILQSFVPVGDYLKQKYVHVEMDSYPSSDVVVGGSEGVQRFIGLQQSDNFLYGKDDIFQAHLQAAASQGVIGMWSCPPIPSLKAEDCYLHIEDEVEMKGEQQQSSNIETSANATLTPAFICNIVKMLHMHNSLSITGIPFPPGSNWNRLEWCQVESCPKLGFVFPPPQDCGGKDIFYHLRTFWASQLPEVQHIWSWSPQSQPSKDSFHWLKLLHLDRCSRLVYVLPFSTLMATLPYLETLEIICCADLMEVFPLSQEKLSVIEFPRLRIIHLFELPMMQRICGRTLFAPRLETIKIRGCWNLRHMPIRGGNIKPKVDCEKEWWDGLEWDGLEVKHHPSLYRCCNSPYYKNSQLPRSTILSYLATTRLDSA